MNSFSLNDLEAALLTVLPGAVFHYDAPEGVERYVVYTEFGERALYGDDAAALSLPVVQLDVITQDEADSLVSDIRERLAELEQVVVLRDSYYDDELLAVRSVLEVTLL